MNPLNDAADFAVNPGPLLKAAASAALAEPRPEKEFLRVASDRYRLIFWDLGITVEVDRLRRDRGELIGEPAVYCHLPGAKTVNGALSIATLNLSSARARLERGKLLAARAKTKDVDWVGLMEEFCQLTIQAEREGEPAIELQKHPLPLREDHYVVDGLVLPRRHPAILFGDGGSAKSYLALWLAGRLSEQGVLPAIFDWELAADDHRVRLELLFGPSMPRIIYVRCERPLIEERDRLRRFVISHKIDYAFYDSVAFACHGPPESAEVASAYFRAVREIGIGSLHIAHTPKTQEGIELKPFGSVFWHNCARMTWFVKAAEQAGQVGKLRIGLFNRKANLGALCEPIGFEITFSSDRTHFRPLDVTTEADLAAQMTIRQRVVAALRRRAMSIEELAEEVEAKRESVERTIRRHRNLFVVMGNRKIGLATPGTEALSSAPGG